MLTYLASQVILTANNMPRVSFQDFAVKQFVLGVIMPIFYAIITVVAAFLFNSSAGAITFSLGLIVLPALVKMFLILYSEYYCQFFLKQLYIVYQG